MKIVWKISVPVTFLAVLTFFLFTTAFDVSGFKDTAVKVGVIAPLSGPFASGGNAFMKSLSIAAKQVNERGGAFGKKVHLLQGDSEGLVSRARNEALRLIEKEEVHFLVGAYLSEETMGVVEVAAKYGIILMVPISATDEITDLVKRDPRRYRYVFRTGYSITRWASMIGEFILSRGFTQYAFIGTQIRWNRELRNSLKHFLGERGVREIIADFYSAKQPLTKPLALRIKKASPQVIVVGDPGKNAIEVIKSLEATSYGGPVISVGGTLADTRIVAELQPNLDLFALASCFPGSSKKATEYYEMFEKMFGYIPSGYSDTLPGDALSILIEAADRAGSLDGNRVIEELSKGRFAGAAGTYTFDRSNQANWGNSEELSGVIIRWDETSFELVYPVK